MEKPTVTVKNGKLQGRLAKNYKGDEFYSFQGIPYGKAPIGPLRFKPPVPAEPWQGVRDATQDGNDCISYNPIIALTSGSEDCLFLNVFTRELPNKSNNLKPVMFWVHGGGFTMGSGSTLVYGPDFFLTKDIVLVTINYRVGLLGFLNFEDPSLEVSGNMGLKDQVLALKWVQENIKQFNGDPNNVTIFGVSAGAASVHYLLVSPSSKGLFHKCIMQSGCLFSYWAKGHRSFPFLSEVLEPKVTSEKDALKVLQNMDASELIEMQKKISDDFQPSFKRCIGPVVESNTASPFLSEEPETIIKSGNYHKVPIIIGYTSREGMIADPYSSDGKRGGYSIQNFENKIPYSLNIQEGSKMSRMIANKIKKFYYDEQKTSEHNKNQYFLIQGDFAFIWPTFKTIKLHTATLKMPIYLFKMSAETSLNYLKKLFNIDSPGACHGDDLGYMFKSVLTPDIIRNSTEEEIMTACVTLWTNFATSGNPNKPQKDSIKNVNWTPVDGDNFHYLNIGENLTTGLNPEELRFEFWKEILGLCKNKL